MFKKRSSASVSSDPLENKGRSRFFFRKRGGDIDEEKVSGSGNNEDEVLLVPTQPKAPEAIGFFELFRFATKTEIFMDIIGLVAAAAAGAAQPLMALPFGNLANEFVNFGKVAQDAGFDISDPRLAQAADDFRRIAAGDAAVLTYIGIGIFVTTYIYMYVWVYTGEVMVKRIREKYLGAVLRQEIAFFDDVGAGEITTRIQTDTHLVQQGTSEKVAITINFLGSFVCGFIFAYIRSWRLALACSSIVPWIILTGGLTNKFVSKYMLLSRSSVASSGTIAEEVISTVRTVQAFGTQKKLHSLYAAHAQEALVVDLKAAIFQGLGIGVIFFSIYAAYALAFSFGTTLILDGHADVGVVVGVFLAILVGSFSLLLLAPEIQAIMLARGAAPKLFMTIDRIPSIDSASPEGSKPENLEGRIELDHVTFNYPSRSNVPILKDLSITFEASKTAALVGASGSGKSTIVSLLERFYDPLEGSVKLDGQDIRTLNVKWLRSQIGLVSQEPTLFATTISGNVAHGLIGSKWEHASEEEKIRLIKEACVKANADGFINKLPDGYDTMVGERGFLLSGGQKQRVAIARAIVSDPRILLLDEATSALDTQSEGIVQDALDKAAAGRTTITIAHRLSTIKDADRIFVMGAGVVLEQGTHAELLGRENGAYARLVQAQNLREGHEQEAYGSDVLNGEESGLDSGAAGTMAHATIEGMVQEEVPLGRRETGSRSIASAIIEQRQEKTAINYTKNFGFPYLFMRLGKINHETWWMYGIGSCFAIVSGMVYPVFGIVYGIGIQGFQLEGHKLRIQGDRTALWLFLVSVAASIAYAAQNYLFSVAGYRLMFKLRFLSFNAILRQDIEFFDESRNSTGVLISNLSDNPQKINGLAGITLGTIVQSIVCLLGAVIIGLAYGWKLALVGVACVPFVISTGYIRLRVVVLKDQRNKEAHESSAQLACEAAAAIRTVASLTREDDCCRLYSQSLLAPLGQSRRSVVISNLVFSLSQASVFFAISLIFWYGTRLVASTEYRTEQFYIVLTSTVFGSVQAGNVFSLVPDISLAQGAASDIIHLLDSRPEIDAESFEGKTPTDVQGHIRFENVHFRYPTRPGVRVLRSLNIEAKPGTFIALVGASGCGKSTVIQLIERFYDPLAGKVYLDDQLISEFNVQEYRRHIALVSQEPTLYAGTLRFNILLGAIKPTEEVTQEELEAACRDANILSFIQSLPDGFETEVGGKGSQLSGGQKQRIAIARALLRNPKVLLLDEATSALDSNSESVVQEALDQAAQGRTTIAIAHRLSTIQNADNIYFIKDGAVSESGTHDQLLARRGEYYEYVQLQALRKK